MLDVFMKEATILHVWPCSKQTDNMEVYSEIHSVVSVVRIVCHTKFVSQIGPAVFCVKPEYMRVCLAYVCVERRHETKMDTNLGKKNPQS